MKRITTFLFAALAAIAVRGQGLVVDGSGDAAGRLKYYLFAYFEGTGTASEQEHLRFAISENGTDWLALNNNQKIISSDTIAKTHGIRDPHILRAEDGKTFLMVATDMKAMTQGWDQNPGIVLMRSEDLVHWTHASIDFPATWPAKFGNAKYVWAPQTIYDPEAGKYMVYFSYSTTDDGSLYTYYAYANSDFTALEGEPQVLFKAKNTCLDNDIILKDGTYHMFYKGNDGAGKDGIMQATATSLKGPWTELNQFIDVYANTSTDVEGSGVFKFIDRDEYVLMYDLFKSKRYEYQTSTDLYTFSSTSRQFTKDFQPRHGTVIAITGAEAEAVVRAFPSALVSIKGEGDDTSDLYSYNIDLTQSAALESATPITLTDGSVLSTAVSGTGQRLYVGGSGWQYASDSQCLFNGTDGRDARMAICGLKKGDIVTVYAKWDWVWNSDAASENLQLISTDGVQASINGIIKKFVITGDDVTRLELRGRHNGNWAQYIGISSIILQSETDFGEEENDDDDETGLPDEYVNASESAPYDVTTWVKNPTCTQNYGWERNAADAAANYNSNNADFNNALYSGTCIESWYWSPVQNGWLIWQDVAGALPGTYRLRAYVCGQIYNDASRKGQNGGGLYLCVGDGSTAITSNTWQEIEVTGTATAGSPLRIGIYADNANVCDWTGIANVRLECIGAGEPSWLAIDERSEAFAATSDTYANVLLTRYVSDTEYTPLSVPFNISKEKAAEYFAEVKQVSSVTFSGDEATLKLTDADHLTHGKVYLVRARQAGLRRMEFPRVMVYSATPVKTLKGEATLTAVYRKAFCVADAWLPQGDGKCRKAESPTDVKACSWYITK